MLQLHLSDQQFYCLLRLSHIRGLMVYITYVLLPRCWFDRNLILLSTKLSLENFAHASTRKFCTCLDSWVVKACTEFCSDLMVKNLITGRNISSSQLKWPVWDIWEKESIIGLHYTINMAGRVFIFWILACHFYPWPHRAEGYIHGHCRLFTYLSGISLGMRPANERHWLNIFHVPDSY